MCSISLWIDNTTPYYDLGDTACKWTRDRIVAKIKSIFMNLQKSVIIPPAVGGGGGGGGILVQD